MGALNNETILREKLDHSTQHRHEHKVADSNVVPVAYSKLGRNTILDGLARVGLGLTIASAAIVIGNVHIPRPVGRATRGRSGVLTKANTADYETCGNSENGFTLPVRYLSIPVTICFNMKAGKDTLGGSNTSKRRGWFFRNPILLSARIANRGMRVSHMRKSRL